MRGFVSAELVTADLEIMEIPLEAEADLYTKNSLISCSARQIGQIGDDSLPMVLQ